jgi:hypothetical protein
MDKKGKGCVDLFGFKNKKEKAIEKIDVLLEGFNATHKYISDNYSKVLVLDHEKHLLGFIDLK